MKKLLMLPFLVLLTGCVTYYYPETAFEDGVYYAEDDPSYTVYSAGYAGGAYYPWASLDYFYLGYNPYPTWGFGYGYNSGFSFGVSYGYSPWYYPYNNYGYYSPWYASYYRHSYYPAWGPYRGYCSHHNSCGHYNKNNHRGDRHDRYAGNDNNNRHNRSSEDYRDKRNAAERRNQDNAGGHNTSARRYVSTAPAGYSGNRGMVIRSNGSAKIGQSQLHGNQSVPRQSAEAARSSSRSAQPNYSVKRTTNEVRYRSDAKQSRSRTGPVTSDPPSRGIAMTAVPSANTRAVVDANRGRQPAPTNSGREASGRPPSNPSSLPTASSKPVVSSRDNNRSSSRSHSGSRSSRNDESPSRKERR